LAVAPELYARQGDVSKHATIDEIRTKVVSKVPDAQVLADLEAAAAWTASSGKGNDDDLGITGFCWVGRIVWLYAAHNGPLKAGGGRVATLARMVQTIRRRRMKLIKGATMMHVRFIFVVSVIVLSVMSLPLGAATTQTPPAADRSPNAEALGEEFGVIIGPLTE